MKHESADLKSRFDALNSKLDAMDLKIDLILSHLAGLKAVSQLT